ncbi:hypothetical protein SAMN04488514_1271, partial [Kriegella aquimaris]
YQIGHKVLYLKAWVCLLSPPNLLDLAIKKEKYIEKIHSHFSDFIFFM